MRFARAQLCELQPLRCERDYGTRRRRGRSQVRANPGVLGKDLILFPAVGPLSCQSRSFCTAYARQPTRCATKGGMALAMWASMNSTVSCPSPCGSAQAAVVD
eukprot:1090643-Pleurochrysis_carterae.AAC.4